MNGLRRSRSALLLGIVLVATTTGCRSAGRRSASAEPGMTTASPSLGAPTDSNGTVVATAPPSNPAWYDHHPLFSRPKHYYDTTQSNKIVKAGVATVVGVPSGIIGEIKQIVTGEQVDSKY
ncbi:MAG: hypothetical protein U0794_14510 [Isosphaeraceae bacterium]